MERAHIRAHATQRDAARERASAAHSHIIARNKHPSPCMSSHLDSRVPVSAHHLMLSCMPEAMPPPPTLKSMPSSRPSAVGHAAPLSSPSQSSPTTGGPLPPASTLSSAELGPVLARRSAHRQCAAVPAGRQAGRGTQQGRMPSLSIFYPINASRIPPEYAPHVQKCGSFSRRTRERLACAVGRPMRNAAGGPQARPLESPLSARRRGSRGLAWRQQAGRRLGPSGRPPRRDVGEGGGGAGAHVFLPRAFARADGGGGAPSGGGASVRLVQYVQHTSLRHSTRAPRQGRDRCGPQSALSEACTACWGRRLPASLCGASRWSATLSLARCTPL